MKTRALAMAALPVVALVAVILLIGALGGWTSPERSPLRGVPAEAFAEMRLEPATPDTTPAISEADAIALAEARPEPGEARQALLARDLFAGGRLVWVINFDPRTVPPAVPLGGCWTGHETIQTVFSLIVIDAETGEYAGGRKAGRFLEKPPDCDRFAAGESAD